LEMERNATLYKSPEEKAREHKAKMKVKQHFQRFFRHHAVKKNTIYFLKWRAWVEFKQNREHEHKAVQAYIDKKREFHLQLKQEKEQSLSADPLNGPKSSNINTLKDQQERDEDPTVAQQKLDDTMQKKKDEQEAVQNLAPIEPSKELKRMKLFKDVFSVFKQKQNKFD